MKKIFFPFFFICLSIFTFSCGSDDSSKSKNTSPVNTQATKPEPFAKRIFIRSLGIRADVMSDHIKSSSKDIFRLFSPDNNYEYYIKWETGQTHVMMKGAMTTGVDMGNGMLTRAIGTPMPLGDKAEAFEYGVYELKTEELLFRGYEVHDWSNPKRILVVSSMSMVNNATEAKARCESLYNSIEVLKEEELKATLAKIENDRFTIGRGENEEEIYRKVVAKSLIRIIPDPANPTKPTTQRFDLCAAGQGLYLLKSASLPDEDRVQGFWDIYETENGELLLIISQTNGPEGRWAIGPHISGNIAIGGIEFKVEPLGTMGGSVTCGEVSVPN